MRGLLLLLVGLVGCGQRGADKVDAAPAAPPSAARVDAAVDDTAAVPQAAPPVKDLEGQLAAAEPCVVEGRPRQACLGFERLRSAVRSRKGDAAWRDGLLDLAKGQPDAPRTRLALTLLADGSMNGPADIMVTALLPLTDSTDAFVRASALRALATYDSPGVAEKALTVIENDPDPGPREAAAYVLGKPQQHRAGPAAVTALLRALANDADASVKRAAIGSLGMLHPPEALPALIALMDDPLLGPNALVQLGGFQQGAAYRSILSRISKVRDGMPLPPAALASLTRLRTHPDYDAAQVRQVLEAALPFVEKDGTPNGRIAHELVKRQLAALAPPSAPPSAPPGGPATGPAMKPGK
ncbi:MAG: HEAT repeat domain-containing protein [bacterium]